MAQMLQGEQMVSLVLLQGMRANVEPEQELQLKHTWLDEKNDRGHALTQAPVGDSDCWPAQLRH